MPRSRRPGSGSIQIAPAGRLAVVATSDDLEPQVATLEAQVQDLTTPVRRSEQDAAASRRPMTAATTGFLMLVQDFSYAIWMSNAARRR